MLLMTFLIWGQMLKLTSYRNVRKKKKTAMPVHHVLKRRRAPICRHSPHQNAPTTNRGPHVFHPMAPDLTDYLGRRKVPRCSLRYFRSSPSLTLTAIRRIFYCVPPPPGPTCLTPAPRSTHEIHLLKSPRLNEYEI